MRRDQTHQTTQPDQTTQPRQITQAHQIDQTGARRRREEWAALVAAFLLAVPALVDLPATDWTGHHGRPVSLPIAPLVIDVNAAPVGDLSALPGVGPVLARRIAAERERMPFSGADDLIRAHGIGPATVERLRPYLRFGPTRPVSLRSERGP